MVATLLDGKSLSEKIKKNLKDRIDKVYKKVERKPVLAVVLIGENPASKIYVASKERDCASVGIESRTFQYPTMTQKELEVLIQRLNEDPEVNGILVQLPLPEGMDEDKIINTIDPYKDVDGFHPYNTGKLWIDLNPHFFPCTPWGVYRLIEEYDLNFEGKEVVILGRSNIVGKPLAGIFSQKIEHGNATVTICHSKTRNLEEHLKRADVIVAAMGKPEFLKKEMIKEGAVILDVGINRVNDPESPKGYRVTGDVDFADVKEKASYITPVPGGVGPMTIAILLENTLKGFLIQNGLKEE